MAISLVEGAHKIAPFVWWPLFKQARIRVYLRPSAVKKEFLSCAVKKLLLFDHFA